MTIEELHRLLEIRSESIEKKLDLLIGAAERAADGALSLSPRIADLESIATDHELRLQALERGKSVVSSDNGENP